MGKHALLSASSSHRWLNCPPSARLCEKYEDTGSEYAQEGTDAHSLCEYKLKQALGMDAADPTENLSFYNEEMEQCALDYAAYVLELVEDAKKTCKDPVVLIEQRLDFSRFVKDGFGTGDCVIIADGTLDIVDYKHGKGVEVSAVENPQMMLYALGALELFDGIYDIDTVRMTIFQPRRDNVSVCVMAKDDLLQWAYNDLTYKAKLAYEGGGEFACGDWCRFCKAALGEAIAGGGGSAADMAGMAAGLAIGQQMAAQMAGGAGSGTAWQSGSQAAGGSAAASVPGAQTAPGAGQPQPGAIPNFCPNCGTKTNGMRFCGNCGYKLV